MKLASLIITQELSLRLSGWVLIDIIGGSRVVGVGMYARLAALDDPQVIVAQLELLLGEVPKGLP